METVNVQRKCIICKSTHGKSTSFGTETWYHHTAPYNVRLCSDECLRLWNAKPVEMKLYSIYLDTRVVSRIIKMAANHSAMPLNDADKPLNQTFAFDESPSPTACPPEEVMTQTDKPLAQVKLYYVITGPQA